MQLILPSDYWIVAVSIVVILLLSFNKYRYIAYIGLIITTAVIIVNYNILRATIHIILTVVTVYFFRIVSSILITEQIKNDEK